MRVYLIRHGETAWNRESRIQGREDVPLDERGVAQSQRCARAFSRVKLAAVLTSPLTRAVQTAEAIGAATGAPVYREFGLIERDFGSVSGKVIDIFRPEDYASDLEPLDDVADRMLEVLTRWAGRLDGDFAAVSHGGSINAVLRALSGGEIGSGVTRLKNNCVCVLRFEDGAFSIERYNEDAEDIL